MNYYLSLLDVAMILDCIEAKLDILRGIEGTNEKGKKYIEDEFYRLGNLFSYLEDPFLEVAEQLEKLKENNEKNK